MVVLSTPSLVYGGLQRMPSTVRSGVAPRPQDQGTPSLRPHYVLCHAAQAAPFDAPPWPLVPVAAYAERQVRSRAVRGGGIPLCTSQLVFSLPAMRT